ncbi:MAG: caspase family protein [Pseudomonadota bacterium]
MRLPIAVALLTLTTTLGSPARADDSKVCYSDKSAPRETIQSCGNLLRSKKVSAKDLPAALSRRAAAYMKQGDLEDALKDADAVIRAAPSSDAAFELRAHIWLRKNDLERARRDADDAVRLGPKAITSYNTRGFILHLSGHFDQAIADFDQALKLDPKQASLFSNRGISWQGKADYARAMADQNQAIKLKPKESVFYSARGGLYREMGDFDRALADFDQATRMNPALAPPFAGRGPIWRARAEFDRAIAEFDKAIALDPNFLGAYAGRGLANESRGDLNAAKRDYKLALERPNVAPVGGGIAIHTTGERYRSIAQSRLQVLEASAASRPAPVPAPAPSTAIKERRIALVIGNSAYTGASKLANPANDAATIAKALRGIGFEVSEGLDLTTQKMKDTINDFLRRASTASMAVMFYAGHGMQIDGKNYLVPTDARLDSGDAMIASVSDVDTILAGLDDQLRTNIVILDACRDNPTVQQTQTTVASRSVQIRSGLAAQSGLGAGATIGAGTLVAFATAPGQVALDGDGANSPFSAALARHISTPGLEVQQMLTRVRAEVVAATRNKQVPWSNSSLLGEVFLASR